MQVNKINSNSSFGMPVAKDFRKIWSKPKGPLGDSCEEILKRLDQTTPLHFITRPQGIYGTKWVAAPKLGSDARRITVAEDSIVSDNQYYSLVKLDEKLEKEYKRLARLEKVKKGN